MKTTNYEISKKLKEIGFHEENQCGFTKKEGSFVTELDSNFLYEYPSYDLEIILEALPKYLKRNSFDSENEYEIYGDEFPLVITPMDDILFSIVYLIYAEDWDTVFEVKQLKDESLADTAARLLILLHEEGIVKFND